jgi:SAM-dependent methyltransferase
VARSIVPWRSIPSGSPELSDLLAPFDATGARAPLERTAILATLVGHGNDVGARIVSSLRSNGNHIDPEAADAALLEAHVELQRLSEEFDHGRRVAELVLPMLEAARQHGAPWPMHVTDVGCGLAYVARYLAYYHVLGRDVRLAGRDFNPSLIAAARSLATEEALEVDFAVGDATAASDAAGIALSTGVLHHLPIPELRAFFAQQRARVWGFAHFDFQPTRLAPLGAWVFHRARFRSALARHDGVLSALRAHEAGPLLDAASDPSGAFSVAVFGARMGPFPRVFHAVVGVRSELKDAFALALGPRAARLGPWR